MNGIDISNTSSDENSRSLGLPCISQSQRLWYDASRDTMKRDTSDSSNNITSYNEIGNNERTQSFVEARQRHQNRSDAPINNYLEVVPHETYLHIIRDSFPVAQELTLTILAVSYQKALLNDVDIFCEHTVCSDDDKFKLLITILLVLMTLYSVVQFNKHKNVIDDHNDKSNWQKKKDRVIVRMGDFILLVLILRALSSLMRSLTASFSSDTVSSLVTTGWIVHLFACDYDFANGKCGKGRDLSLKREKFKGGHTSLSGALLSTTLLASRLSSDVHTFMFVSTSIILFAFYPAHRANISMHQSILPSLLVTCGICCTACIVLDNKDDRKVLIVTLAIICIFIPGIKYWLQKFKKIIVGPWTVVQVPSIA